MKKKAKLKKQQKTWIVMEKVITLELLTNRSAPNGHSVEQLWSGNTCIWDSSALSLVLWILIDNVAMGQLRLKLLCWLAIQTVWLADCGGLECKTVSFPLSRLYNNAGLPLRLFPATSESLRLRRLMFSPSCCVLFSGQCFTHWLKVWCTMSHWNKQCLGKHFRLSAM